MLTGSVKDSAGGTVDRLSFLSADQVLMIDEALNALGSYGEVRLSVRKGRLRFLVMQKSFDALKGRLDEEDLSLIS